MKNFEEQIEWLAENGILIPETASLERLILTLNEAAFSQKEISDDAFHDACRFFVC